MRRHSTKQPIGPATAPSMAAPATARQNSSSMMVMSGMARVVRRMKDRPRRAMRVIVAMGVERDLIGHARTEKSDESRVAHHRGGVALAANMPVEADNMIGRRHDDVEVVADQQDGRAQLGPH